MRILLLKKSLNLVKFKSEILDLFELTFGKKMLPSLWDWCYFNEISGEPIVALAEDKNRIVGHYAMIPMPFFINDQEVVGYLSMTTMVAPDYQGQGLFKSLADTVYREAPRNSFVYGFPNMNSKFGFESKLNWQVDNSSSLISIEIEKLLNFPSPFFDNHMSNVKLRMNETKYLSWRLSKPETLYYSNNNLIYKVYGNTIDLIHWEDIRNLRFLSDFKVVNIITSNEILKDSALSVVPYFFGYRKFFDDSKKLTFTPFMIMSDVF